ncbi:MAG: trimeric intracellular cation channel family protein [Zavarzinella sp.]
MLNLLDLLGIGLFGVSGCISAARKNFDLVGVCVVALVTAVGGGTLRDLLLDRHPILWIRNPVYLYVIFSAIPLTWIYTRYRSTPNQLLLVADAIGLSVYSILGVQAAQSMGHAGLVAIIMGVMTGTAGGVIRDVICNDVPILFQGGYLYATASFAGCLVYIISVHLELPKQVSVASGMLLILMLRTISIVYRWNLPAFQIIIPTKTNNKGI